MVLDFSWIKSLDLIKLKRIKGSPFNLDSFKLDGTAGLSCFKVWNPNLFTCCFRMQTNLRRSPWERSWSSKQNSTSITFEGWLRVELAPRFEAQVTLNQSLSKRFRCINFLFDWKVLSLTSQVWWITLAKSHQKFFWFKKFSHFWSCWFSFFLNFLTFKFPRLGVQDDGLNYFWVRSSNVDGLEVLDLFKLFKFLSPTRNHDDLARSWSDKLINVDHLTQCVPKMLILRNHLDGDLNPNYD